MSVIVIVLVAAVPVALLGLVLGLIAVLVRRPAPAPSEAAAVARQHGVVVSIASWVAWLVVPALVATAATPALRAVTGGGHYGGLVTALYPAMVGLAFVAVHALGERTWPRPAGPVRRATLVRRRVTDVAPRLLRRAAWAWAAGIALVLVLAGAVAAPGGRAFARTLADGSWAQTSPFPGWYYGMWLLPASLLVLAAGEAVLRLIASRPAIVDAEPAYDAASRTLSAHRVLRGVQLVLGLTLAAILLTCGYGPHGVGLVGVGYALDLVALATAVGSAALAMVPGRAPTATTVPDAVATGRPALAGGDAR